MRAILSGLAAAVLVAGASMMGGCQTPSDVSQEQFVAHGNVWQLWPSSLEAQARESERLEQASTQEWHGVTGHGTVWQLWPAPLEQSAKPNYVQKGGQWNGIGSFGYVWQLTPSWIEADQKLTPPPRK